MRAFQRFVRGASFGGQRLGAAALIGGEGRVEPTRYGSDLHHSVDALRMLVEAESPSSDPVACAACAQVADKIAIDVLGQAAEHVTVQGNTPHSSVAAWAQRQDGTLRPAVFRPVYDVPGPLVIGDVNADGRADKASRFADGLTMVQGVEPGEGGVFASDEGKIAVCRDKTGVVHACSAVCTPARSCASVVEAPRCGVTTTFG